jgi:hypothetical protein
VGSALARERLSPPPCPSLAQRHPGELRHQVELGGPYAPERHREVLGPTILDPEVMGGEALRRDVVFVYAPALLAADVEQGL